jgi:pyruvate dehydrogenase E1 component
MDEQSFRVIERKFRMNGWDVITLKYGKQMQDAFERPGGRQLWDWVNKCDNARYSALTSQGGPAWREELMAEAHSMGEEGRLFGELVQSYSDETLQSLMCNLGGHCF